MKKIPWPGILAVIVIGLFILIFNFPGIVVHLVRNTNRTPTILSQSSIPPMTVHWNKWTINEYGHYEIVGEVVNKSSRTFRFVEVKADFLNNAGIVVGTDTAYACGADYILPGGKKSFKMMDEQQPDYKVLHVSICDFTEVK